MKCPECGAAELTSTTENHRYRECGLSNVILESVSVRRCAGCGAHLVSNPKMAELHHAIALALVTRPERLRPEEVRFLRKSLGWSGADFARHFHVRPEQVSRWESRTAATRMSVSNELLLRALVAHGRRVDDYAERMEQFATSDCAQPGLLCMERIEDGWRPAA